MLNDTQLAVPALEMPVDGLTVLVRQAVRGAIGRALACNDPRRFSPRVRAVGAGPEAA